MAALKLDLILLFAKFRRLSCLNFFKAEVVIGILNSIVASFQNLAKPLYLGRAYGFNFDKKRQKSYFA